MKTKVITTVVIILAVGVLVWLGVSKPQEQTSNLPLQGKAIPILGRDHVPEGTKVTDYNSNPPTSGNHWPQPAEWGIYNEPLPDEQLVHNLEHGGIWISYQDVRDIDEEAGEKLEAIVEKFPRAVIITERPQNQTAFAIASWGRLYTSDSFDQGFAEKFIRANINNSPEKLARLEASAVAVDSPFLDFTLTELDGRILTKQSLAGKPAIVWFTTEFCVPCQIGAREVSKLDDELGGSAFDVLVIFVDPRETKEDLRSWRERFARDDWMVAFDNFDDTENSLSSKVGLKYLDSKYLLDKNGIIQDIDFQIADEKYLDLIRGIVENSSI